MDEETKKAIKVGKQILAGRRTDNIEIRGYNDEIEYMKRKFKYFFVENVLLLLANLVLLIFIFAKII